MRNDNYTVRISRTCCGITIGMGVLTFAGWLSGLRVLARVRPDYIPMAPNTAAVFILLGIAVLVLTFSLSFSRFSRWFSTFSAILTIVLSILTILQYFIHVDLAIDQLILKTSGLLGKVPVGCMSPITAGNFLLAGVSLLLLSLPSHQRLTRDIASCLAVVTTITGLVVILGYLYGTPILYGGNTIPMAITTATAFVCLGIAIIAKSGLGCLPVRSFAGTSTRARLMRVFFPATIVTILVENLVDAVFILKLNFNPALVIAMYTVVFASIVGIFVLRVSKTVGDDIDRAEAIRRQAEEEIRKLLHAIEQSPAVIMITNTAGNIEYVNPKFTQITGYSKEEVIGKNPRILKSGKMPPEEYKRMWDTIISGGMWQGEFHNWKKNGELYWESATISPVRNTEGVITHFMAIKEDITEIKQMADRLKENEEKFRLLFESSQDGILAYDNDIRYILWNKAMEQISGVKREALLGKSPFEVFPFLKEVGEEVAFRNAVKGKPSVREAMPYNVPQTGRHGFFQSAHFPLFDAKDNIIGGMAIVRDVTEQMQNEQRIKAQHAVTQILVESSTIEEASLKIIEVVCECLAWDVGELWLADKQKGVLCLAKSWHAPTIELPGFEAITRKTTFAPGIGLPGRVWQSGKPVWVVNITQDAGFPRAEAAVKEGLRGAFCFPVEDNREVIGVIDFLSRTTRQPDNDLLNMMTAIGRQIGLFIKRKQSEEQTKIQFQRISALHEVDMAITGSFDLRLSLNIFLEKVITLLNVDAADVYIFNKHMQALEYVTCRGFLSDAIKTPHVFLGDEMLGRAVSERHLINIPDLCEVKDACNRARILSGEGYVSYYAMPLAAKGYVNGVLELVHRIPFHPDQDWLNFLDILATQAAVVIDDAMLFDELRHANIELMAAYDRTIEGWSRALDLRDKETEGHSRRVTDVTVKVAEAMGIGKEELAHIRRGALLHDIGKMGIPDRILLKPVPLTDKEWAIMRKHPVFAYELLWPIVNLRPAIDIPYCHHEKWDGTGYPRGLRGKDIPMAARIFAVVDVWDAMIFDRPYRKGWAKEKALEYIRSNAGIHFDPKVAEVFLKMKR
ncbi:MAG: PAS domain S-box protein [Planctomycetes bacterium]|nr:PAS domain S-box protein [Planctomycetota bacterium]